ncbi:MAG: hypothetical protein H0A76_06045 [Candidatus Thiodubiliella endoseptemdiera]|uniref:Uncharacterized protein n=1 Tax=Candidatus Thiodubiliella endoseptemdiera TaxID=2738886 RepID=A0A853F4I4_9GAMM|nr:hypothetical protein [Candidatus Thiodubiliella endoseptemdiera]
MGRTNIFCKHRQGKGISIIFAISTFGDLCINMNNHQNAIFHQITNFLKTPLALLEWI